MLEMAYSTSMQKPNIAPLTTPQALWCRAPTMGQSTSARMPSAPPTMWVTMLVISSPRV